MTSTLKLTFHDTVGSLFEEELSEAIGTFSMKEWGKGAFVSSSIVEDQHQGIDFTVLGVPMDVTLNVAGKNRTRWFSQKIDLGFGKVNFGFRTGNGKVTFDKPVLILGFNIGEIRKGEVGYLVKSFAYQLQEILNCGMDLYLDAEETGKVV